MKLTILGSGTHVPVKNRSNPAYLLDIDGETILLDCGSGTLRQIAKAGRNEFEISKIFLSHSHIDHTMDLIPLFFTLKYQRSRPLKKSIKLFAHTKFQRHWQSLEAIYGKWIKSENQTCQYVPVLPDEVFCSNFKVESFATAHSEDSLIFKFTDRENRSLVYSGDTSPTEELIRAAYRADLLILECTIQR